jgi:short-subunit dehydrogenase
MDIPLKAATAAVVGATGTIGRVCAELLAEDVARLYLIGRREAILDRIAGAVGGFRKSVSTRLDASRVDSQHKDGRAGRIAVDFNGDKCNS